jgi:hypothetical protein
MNANEAISKIRFMLDVGGSDGFTSSDKEALNMAIDALTISISEKPRTNGDRIRQMSDEELAKKLHCDSCLYQIMKSECETSDCAFGILAWLRKER